MFLVPEIILETTDFHLVLTYFLFSDVVSDRFAEFILRRDGLEVSFLVGGVNDVY